MSNAEATEKILSGYRMPPPPDCPPEIYELMLQCWQRDPSLRPSFKQLSTSLDEIGKEMKRIAQINSEDPYHNNTVPLSSQQLDQLAENYQVTNAYGKSGNSNNRHSGNVVDVDIQFLDNNQEVYIESTVVTIEVDKNNYSASPLANTNNNNNNNHNNYSTDLEGESNQQQQQQKQQYVRSPV